MKRIFLKFFCFFLFIISALGCTDLEYEDFSRINTENFPQGEADLEAAVTGVYHTLSQSYIQTYLDNAGWTHNTLSTDELNTSWGHNWQQTDQFLWRANDMSGAGVYNEYQKGITKATRIIDAFRTSDVEEEMKEKYIAELRVLRVIYANYLYSMVGPVPIVKDPEIANDVYSEWNPERPTKDEYLSFMINELLESYDVLDEQVSGTSYGRLTKGAALTLLMKIHLNDKNWSQAAEISQQIINLGVYDLLPSYEAVFDIENEGPDNSEVIFPIQRITSDTDYGWTYFAAVMPATPLYKSQEGPQMQIWGGLKMPWEFYDKYEEQDNRLETIVRYYEDTDGNLVDYREIDHPKATGAAPMKYSEDPEQRGAIQGNDFIVFRYADVILSRAEALNELNGPTEEVIELINMIRERANATPISLEDYTQESLREFLLDERGRELYGEGHRRDDLIRFGEFINKAQERGIDAQDYHVLFPIPQSALNENPNLNQNPGY